MICQDYLKERLNYNPELGEFRWRPVRPDSPSARAWNTKYAGSIAGGIVQTSSGSYIHIKIDSQPYKAHRLAFLYMIGRFPSEDVDHKDLNGVNNKWGNLREASRSNNCANRRRESRNTTGFKGATYHKATGKFNAQIKIRGKNKHLGLFATPEAAHQAYLLAAKKYFGDFARPA